MRVVSLAERDLEGSDGSRSSPGPGDSDAALMARLSAGADHALSAAYDRYGSLVYGLALRILHDRSQAEEVTQDVFVSAWQHRSRFDGARGSLGAWLSATAHNRAIDLTRGRTGRQRLEQEIPSDEPASENVVDVVFAGVDRQAIMEALRRLPALQADAILQAYFGGRTAAEIASATGGHVSTIKGRMRLGLEKLAIDLELRAACRESEAPPAISREHPGAPGLLGDRARRSAQLES